MADNPYADRISGVVNGFMSTHPDASPDDIARAVLDDGHKLYKDQENSNSGHGRIELDKYLQGLQSYAAGTHADPANANLGIAALAAKTTLTGYSNSWGDFFTPDAVFIDKARVEYGKADPRTSDQLSSHIIASLGADHFDPQHVQQATALLKSMKPEELKALDQQLSTMSRLDPNAGVDAYASQYARIVREGRDVLPNGGYDQNHAFNKALGILGQQTVNANDPASERIVKGILAGSTAGDGNTVEYAVKSISDQHLVHYDANRQPLATQPALGQVGQTPPAQSQNAQPAPAGQTTTAEPQYIGHAETLAKGQAGTVTADQNLLKNKDHADIAVGVDSTGSANANAETLIKRAEAGLGALQTNGQRRAWAGSLKSATMHFQDGTGQEIGKEFGGYDVNIVDGKAQFSHHNDHKAVSAAQLKTELSGAITQHGAVGAKQGTDPNRFIRILAPSH